ncbi:MAG: hypothetical protein WBW14_19655 [Candidatus Acidiferrum sp.]|jgi:hypothetical protein|nr:hypothetical protein [Candidatus Acidoferrum sp.]
MTAQIPKTPLPPEDHDQESDAITKLGNQPGPGSMLQVRGQQRFRKQREAHRVY